MKVKRIIALTLVIMMIFTQGASAVESNDGNTVNINDEQKFESYLKLKSMFQVGIGDSHVAEVFFDTGNSLDNNFTAKGKVNDPNSVIENLIIFLEPDGIREDVAVINTLTTPDEYGFRYFDNQTVILEQGITSLYDGLRIEVPTTTTGSVISVGQLTNDTDTLANVISAISNPKEPTGNPEIFFDKDDNLCAQFIVGEETSINFDDFKLYKEDGSTEIYQAITDVFNFEENGEFIVGARLNKELLVNGATYKLEISDRVKDMDHSAEINVSKMWSINVPEPPVVSDPEFKMDKQEYTNGEQVNIELFNVAESGMILLEGSSIAVDENSNEIGTATGFKIQFAENDFQYFRLDDGHFVNKNNLEDYLTIDESPQDKEHYELTGIPVDKLTRNKIVIEYDGTVAEFFYNKGETDVWTHAHKITDLIGTSPVIDVIVGNLIGDENNLHVEILTVDENPTLLAKLGFEGIITSDEHQISQEEQIFRFTSESGELLTDFTDPTMNHREVSVKLVYDENNDEVIEKQENLWQVRIDNGINEPDVYFDGEGIYEETEYYIINVNFNDTIKESSLIGTNFELKEIGSDLVVNPLYVVGEGKENDGNDQLSYWNAKLYFDKETFKGKQVVIKNLEDRLGHTLSEVIREIHMDTHIKGNILDQYGDKIEINEDGHFILVPQDFDLSILNTNEEDGYPDIHQYVRYVHVNANGEFDDWVQPGTYEIFSVTVKNGEEKDVISIDETVEIPFMSGGSTYTFDIQMKESNVFGKVQREGQDLYKEKLFVINTEYLQYIDENDKHNPVIELFGKTVDTDNLGNFSIYLAPGEYKVLGKLSGFSFQEPVNEFTFVVSEGTNTLTEEVIFPQANVEGNILDQEGNPLNKVHVAIISIDDEKEEGFYDAFTDENGQFSVALEDGEYILAAISIISFNGESNSTGNGGMYFINKAFTVENSHTLIDVTLPKANLELKVMNNESLYEGEVGIEYELTLLDNSVEDKEDSIYMFSNTQTGVFNFYFEPGTFNLKCLFAYNHDTGEHLEVKDINELREIDVDSDYTGNNAIVIDLSSLQEDSSNVMIMLVDEDGNAETVSGYGMEIQGQDKSFFEWRKTNEEGIIYLNLEKGRYKIPGIHMNGQWKEMNIDFEVTDEHTADNKRIVPVVIKQPNVSGVVQNENGEAIPHAWVEMEKMPTGDQLFSEYKGFGTNQDGQFAIDLDEGEYVVKGISYWNEEEQHQEWQEMIFKFSVVEVEGELEVKELIIKKAEDNVKGFVFKKYDAETEEGTPFDGTMEYDDATDGTKDEFNHVWLVLREYGITEEQFNECPWIYESWVHVEADGSFSTLLDESKTYEVYAVSTPRKYVELNVDGDNPILIGEYPKTDLLVVPPAPNFGGQLLDFDGNPIPNAFVNAEKADATEWMGTQTDMQGYFEMSLKKGEEYVIRDIFYGNKERIQFNQKFTVGEGTSNLILKPNVKGSLDIGEITLGDNEFAGIGIRKVIKEDHPDFEDSMMNPWKYESWMEVRYEEGSDVGQFIGYLEEGKYMIFGMHSPDGWKQLDMEIELNQTNSDMITYNTENDTYEMNINYTPNVSGQVLDEDGNPIDDAWVDITTNENRCFGTNTDSNGEFGIKLADGDYRINGYSTKGYWENNQWVNGRWINVNHEFSVVDGQLEGIDSITIRPNVSGYVMKYDKELEEYMPISEAWFRIKPADENGQVDHDNWEDDKHGNSDETGLFTMMLAPGKYKVIEAGGHDTWMQLNIDIEIDSQGNLVNNSYVDEGKLYIKPEKPNVAGYVKDESGNILRNSHIVIKPIDAEENDWNNAKHISVDKNGYFELSLDNGEYKVTEIGAPGMWIKLYMPFTVNGDEISSPVEGVVSDNTLEVKPQTANLTGIVKDNEGNELNQNAWLCIKPADADMHDWENAHWLDYKDYNGEYLFKIYLEPGEYKVSQVSSDNMHYEPMTSFTILENGTLDRSSNVVEGKLVVAPPTPNVTGIVFGNINGEEEVLGYGGVNIARVDSEGNQLTFDGNEIGEENHNPHDDIYWHHTKWVNTNENGEFEIRLDEGQYKVISASGNGLWYEADTEFEVVNGAIKDIEVREPSANAQITIQTTNITDNEAWIEVETDKDGNKHFIPVRLTSVDNGNYGFDARLKEGTYKVRSFGTPTYWTEVEEEFVITDESITTNILLDLNSNAKKKVSGQIVSEGIALDEKGWVAIKEVVNGYLDTTDEPRKIQTENDGTFTFKLNEGTTWVIIGLSTSENYIEIDNPLDYSITVTEEAEQEPNNWVIDINTFSTN